MSISQQRCLNYAKQHVVSAIYHTAHIELPELTLTDTKQIVNSGNSHCVNTDDIQTVINIKRAWEELFNSYSEYIDWYQISRYHQILMTPQLPSAGGSVRLHVFK